MVALTSACTPALAYIGPGSGLSLLGGLWSLVVGIVIALAAVLMWPIRLLLRRLGWLRPVVPAATGDRDSTADDHGPHAPSARLPGPRSLLAVLIGLGLLAGFGAPEPPAVPAESRLVVLGFDGMDPALARRWMEAGKLPNFSRLARDGHFQSLGTSNPPQSPVAWSDFATGHGPGHHGIYDFLRRDPATYAPKFSISEDIAPESHLELFGLNIPLGTGRVVNLRQGEAFWSAAERAGARASVLRVPVTWPPDGIHRMLSGMGVPDLLGTQGTYTLYSTTRIDNESTSSRVVRVRPDREGVIETELTGPPDPLAADHAPMRLPLTIEPLNPGARITLGGRALDLAPGEWSDWIRLEFDATGPGTIAGNVRVLLTRDYPRPQLYVSPIQIDPINPAVPISSPDEYAAGLAGRIGLYHTIGMPEETWSLNEEHISDAAWLEMEKTILAEREAMWYDTLAHDDSELVVGVFVQTDRVSHMFYRGLDPEHPRHADTAPEHRDAIEWIYREADRILAQTLDRLGPGDELIVLSDHGFAPFRKAAHLNRWLVDHGYLALAPGQSDSDVLFEAVDWSRSRAYALGLNGLFINRAGREAEGIVEPAEVGPLKREIVQALTNWTDGETQVVRRVFDGDEVYAQAADDPERPDLVIGYQRGYRASWLTTLGAVPGSLIEPNAQKWSGDHCIDPQLVPGVLFASFRPQQPVGAIADVRALIEARVPAPPDAAAATPETASSDRGLLDGPGVILERIDQSLRQVLPASLALAFWAVLSAWLTMWLYGVASNQPRLAEVRAQSKALRARIRAHHGDFGELLPMLGRNLALSGRHLLLALGPAVLAGLPVLLVLVWMSNAYGPRAPLPGTGVVVEITPIEPAADSAWRWQGTDARRVASTDGSTGWVLDWPRAGVPARLVDDQGRELATLAHTTAARVLHPRRWWNALIANPAGYLNDDVPIRALRIELPAREFLSVGPDWARGWMLPYFVVLIVAALGLKRRWGLH